MAKADSRNRNHICLLVDFLDSDRLSNGLVECLGKEQAFFLARAIAMDLLSSVLKVPGAEISMAFPQSKTKQDYDDFFFLYQNEEKEKKLVKRLSEVTVFAQRGDSLCEQVKNSAERVLQRSPGRLLLVRQVVPMVEPLLLEAALELLGKYQVILGPTFEGSFYMMGCNAYYPEVFEGLMEDCGNIYKNMVDSLNHENLVWQELELSYSVEGPAELDQLYNDIENLRLAGDETSCYHTERCLANLRDAK